MNRLTRTTAAGFSLLELVICLFILVILLGMAVSLTRHTFSGENLRQANRKLELFAKTARKQALQENRSYEIILNRDGFSLQPAAASTADTTPPPGDAPLLDYHFARDVHWKVKPWGGNDWETPKQVRWFFSPTGLCAPNRFRFEAGDSWAETTFNPLTANPQDEAYDLP